MARANLKRLEEGKLYYSISEVCAMTGLEQHVLRYWESEFPQLRPKKNRSGNRAYRNKEIKIIRYIKYLLYDEMFTIPGAKKKMADMNLADLEGQMSLLRIPAARAAGPAASAPAAEPDLEDEPGHEEGEEDFPGQEEHAAVAPGLDLHAAPPPETALSEAPPGAALSAESEKEIARLRGELARVRAELAGLLDVLGTAGIAGERSG